MGWNTEPKDYTTVDYLLQEIGDFLLLEDGGLIIAAGDLNAGWNKDVKDLGT